MYEPVQPVVGSGDIAEQLAQIVDRGGSRLRSVDAAITQRVISVSKAIG